MSKAKEIFYKAGLQLLCQKGAAATTKDLAHVTGMSEGALYRYYSNKDALFLDIISNETRQVSAALAERLAETQDIQAALAATTIFLCDLFENNPAVFHVVLLPDRSITQALAPVDCLADAIKRLDAHNAPNALLVAVQVMGMVTATAQAIIQKRLPKPIQDYTESMLFSAFKIAGK